MTEQLLKRRRILIVEDEYMLADELANDLKRLGAIVVGPVGRIDQALDLLRVEPRLDAAILDINLGGQSILPIAERLARDGVPFLFATGYDAAAIPARFADVIRCEKPVSLDKLRQALVRIMASAGPSPAIMAIE